MIVRGIVTTIPDGAPVPDGTEGEIRLLDGDVFHATVETSGGWFEYSQNGSPGPFRIFWDHAGVIKNQYSKITGPSAATDIGNLPLVFRAFSNGVIDGVAGELFITATGSSMSVNIAAGAGLVQGVLYDQLIAGVIPIAAAHATLPRIDTIVMEVVPPGAGDDIEGRSEVVVVQGTAAATPVAPTLTQTTSLWQVPLANVAVGAAVLVIGSDKITDRRTLVAPAIPAGSITDAMLANDAKSVWVIKKSGVTINTVPINRINFNGAFFDVDVNPDVGFAGKQIDIDFVSSGQDALMPVTEFVATGPISSGSRTLVTMGVGPLPTGIPFAVLAYFGVTVRNQINTGTISGRVNINGGANRTHEFQNVGGVPRWCPVTQTAIVTKSPGASFNVVGSVAFVSGDPSDIRAGWVQAVAIPATLLVGA
jgi:hypothetical protein